MRFIIFCINVMLFLSASTQVITWINPLPTGNNLTDVYYLDQERGWAVGDDGTIIKTDLSVSENWWICDCPVDKDLNEIIISSNGTGFIVGDEGTLMRTIDYGDSWTSLSISTNENLNDVEYFDTGKVWVVGNNGFIIYSEDSGNSWNVQNTGDDRSLRSICMINENEGWAGGELYSLYHTINGGQNWSLKYEFVDYGINSVFFIDSLHGWAGGSADEWGSFGRLVKTDDGGESWITLNESNNGIFQVHFFDSLKGWMNKGNYLYSSNDGGYSWSLVEDMLNTDYFFQDDSIGWAVGGYGSAFETTNGGMTWERTNKCITTEYLWSCFFLDEEYGWAGCQDGTVIHTNDGGENWNIQQAGTFLPILDIEFVDRDIGWALSFNRIYKTTNGGVEWFELASFDVDFLDMYFQDSLTGWIVGEQSSIYFTDDGGTSWVEQISDFPLFRTITKVFFLDEMSGWIGGDNGYSFSVDGGKTWNYRSVGTKIADIFFRDEQNGWMIDLVFGVGTRIYRTENGGALWNELVWIPDYSLKELYFLDSNYGYAAASSNFGEEVGVFFTENGGESWQPLKESGSNMMDLSFPDDEHGYVVGMGGQVLKIENDPLVIEPGLKETDPVDLKLYPNPASNHVFVSLNLKESDNANIVLFNSMGKKVMNMPLGRLEKGLHQISLYLENYSPGAYFLHFQTPSFSDSKILMINW